MTRTCSWSGGPWLCSAALEHRLGQLDDVALPAGAGSDDVRSAFAKRHLDHVIMGAGLGLATRLEIVREVFERSDTTAFT